VLKSFCGAGKAGWHFQNAAYRFQKASSNRSSGVVFFIYNNRSGKMPPSFLTRQGYQRLQEELEHLRTVKRQEVANRLREAMEGGGDMGVDLDAEYEAAKNEQAFVEGRIQELEALLANARVIQDGGTRDVVEVGATVTIQEDNNGPEVYTIVGPAEANPRNGLISNESPLGRALIDHRAGDVVKVDAPGGSFTVNILKVE
jgi:transcription elongation factor GreA